jgi:N-methylhydantoinase A
MLSVGVDVGGTFTDIVVSEESSSQTQVIKVPTSAKAPAIAVVQALAELRINASGVNLISHATTLATNALLTRTAIGPTALVTTEGFRDVLEIARQRRPELYNLYTRRPPPLVRRKDRYVVRERILADGSQLEPLDSEEASRVARTIAAKRYMAVAVAFLNSYANPSHERAMARFLRRAGFEGHVSLSSDVDREYREYERTSTAVVNASLSPLVSAYLNSLGEMLRDAGYRARVFIMNSDGGMSTLSFASRYPVRVIESGPAAGVLASRELARALSMKRALTFDMGGTTAKAGSILDWEPDTTYEFEAAGMTHSGRSIKGSGYAVRAPFIDIAEVSSGGGTVAWADEGGALHVGPASAGSEPGPAAYGGGGANPTVTDANLLLGRISSRHLLGGRMALHPDLARGAMKRVADSMGVSVRTASKGVISMANDNMAKAMSIVSVERGRDPRDFSIVAFGGAGPIHCCDLAEILDVKRVVVPVHAGVFSAFGLLAADITRTFTYPIVGAERNLPRLFGEARRQAARSLRDEGFNEYSFEEFVDARYEGQSFELTLPYDASTDIREKFSAKHREVYGYSSEDKIEVVGVRVRAVVRSRSVRFEAKRVEGPLLSSSGERRRVWFGAEFSRAPIFVREEIAIGSHGRGPCVIEEYDSTLVVNPRWDWSAQAYGTELRRR